MEMKIRLREELQEHVPETTKFSLGYMEGRQCTKCWICCEDDLQAMYTAYATCPHKEIMLWCDSRESDDDLPKNKRPKTGDTMTKREEMEQSVLDIAEELGEMHEDSELKLNEVQYRLWV